MKITKNYLKRVIREELEQEMNVSKGMAAGAVALGLAIPAISGLVDSYQKFESEAKQKIQTLQRQKVDIIGAIQTLKNDFPEAPIDPSEIRQLSTSGGSTVPYMRFLELSSRLRLSDEQIAQVFEKVQKSKGK